MSEKGISYRQSWLWQVMDGKAMPNHSETKTLASRDALLDALMFLYDECRTQSRTEHVTHFVKKYKEAISEIRQARVVPNDFHVLDLIGRGQFGKVELVRAREGPSNTVYALKTVPKKVATDPTLAMSVWEERDILTHANSKWLTQAFYAFQDDFNLYLVMEYLPGGDLFSLMRRQEDIFTEENARFYFVEILLGVNAVHHMGYVHRDIKPENILLDHRGHLKLVDFGSSVRIGCVASGHCVGTASYMSPEVLRAADPDCSYVFGPEVDYWALGVILYEMLFFRNPFVSDEENESSIEVIRNIMNWKKSLIFDEEIFQISDSCRSIIANLITESKYRLGYKEVTEHPFLRPVGLSQISEMTPPFIPQVAGEEDTSNFEPPAPGPSITDARPGRSSFAGGDALSHVAFLGYTHSSVQSQARKPRARTSLALEGLPVTALERKWADRASDLRARCHELEARVADLEEQLRRAKWTEASAAGKHDVSENRKDAVPEKDLKVNSQSDILSATDSGIQATLVDEAAHSPSPEGYMTTNMLRQENRKLRQLVSGLTVEIEEQRQCVAEYKSAMSRRAEAEAKAQVRSRELAARLRSLTRRRSIQARRVDEAAVDDSRRMLTTIREQSDVISFLESSRSSLQSELHESHRFNETLQEELRQNSTPGRTTMVDAEAATDVDSDRPPPGVVDEGASWRDAGVPATPRGLLSSDLMGSSTPRLKISTESLLERDRMVTELTHRVIDLVTELSAARHETKEAERLSALKEEELRAATQNHEKILKIENEEKKSLRQKYERMCIQKVEKYDENRELKKIVAQLKSHAESVQVEMGQLRDSDAAIRTDLSGAKERIRELEAENEELRADAEKLRTENWDQRAELRSLRQGQERSAGDWEQRERELTESLSAAQRQRDEVLADAQAKKVALSEAKALLASSKHREATAREAAEADARRLAEMRARLVSAERCAEERSASTARAEGLLEELKDIKQRLQRESEALRAAESALMEANTKVENVSLRNDVLHERIKELEAVELSYRSVSKDLSDLQRQHSIKVAACEELELKLQRMNSQMETERSNNMNKRAKDAGDFTQKLNDLRSRSRTEVDELRNRYDEKESKVAQLSIEVSQLSRDKQNLEEKVEVLSKRLTSSEDEAMRLKEECAQHITTLQHLRRETLDLQRDLDSAEDSYDALSEAKTELEAQLAAQAHEFAVERLRFTSTVQQQGKLIDMLKSSAENAAPKRRGIKHLFGGGSSRRSTSYASLNVLQPSNNKATGSTPRH